MNIRNGPAEATTSDHDHARVGGQDCRRFVALVTRLSARLVLIGHFLTEQTVHLGFLDVGNTTHRVPDLKIVFDLHARRRFFRRFDVRHESIKARVTCRSH